MYRYWFMLKVKKKLFSDIAEDIDRIYVYNEDLPPANLLNRIRWWFNRKYNNIFEGRLDDFISKEQFGFVYPSLPRNNFKKYRFAEWIPDFQYLHFPDGSNDNEIEGRKKQFKNICLHSPLIYVSSEHARNDCESLFPQCKGKVYVMRFCVFLDNMQFPENLAHVLATYKIPRVYFIISNLLAPTKNLLLVIQAVGNLKRKGISIPVVVTGDLHDYRNPGFKNEVFQMISKENVREEIIMLGIIPRIRQKQLLANAKAIIQPSRFEGWNTLVEEAKWLNQTILLSDIPVHLEQARDKGIFFRDNDIPDLAEKMQKIYIADDKGEERQAIQVDELYEKNINQFAHHFITTSFLL